MKPVAKQCIRQSLLAMAMSWSVLPAFATTLDIDLDTAKSMGVKYSIAEHASNADGFTTLARVATPIDHRFDIVSPLQGKVVQWLAESGRAIANDAPVVRIFSAALSDLQRTWLQTQTEWLSAQAEFASKQEMFNAGILSERRFEEVKRDQRAKQFVFQTLNQQLLELGMQQRDLTALAAGTMTPGILTLTAPQAGVLSRATLAVGDPFEAGIELANISDPQQLQVQADIPLAIAKQLQLGQSLWEQNSHHPLTLHSKNEVVNAGNQRVTITADVGPNSHFVPGQLITIVIPHSTQSLQIPATAVTRMEGASYVFVLQEDRFSLRAVTLQAMGNNYAVLDGLAPQDNIVIKGTAQLKGIYMGLGGE